MKKPMKQPKKKRKMSLAVRMYLVISVILAAAFVQMLLISNSAYREAVFAPIEKRLADAEVPEAMVPFLNAFNRYVGTEELNRIRAEREKSTLILLKLLSDHEEEFHEIRNGEDRSLVLDMVDYQLAVDAFRESLEADMIYTEIHRDGKTYEIYPAEKGTSLYRTYDVFGEETAYPETRASDFASPVFHSDPDRGYELLRCAQVELDGGEARLWIRYDMNKEAEFSIGFLWKIILSFLILTAALFTASLILLRRSVIRPVLRLAQAAKNFTPEADGTYSAERISPVNIRTGDEIGELSREIRFMQEQIVENTGRVASLTAERERISTELDLARKIQANALPREIPERKEFTLCASMTPAKAVAGDFYDYFLIDDDHLAVVIADVSGKGIPAALFMMVSNALIRNQLKSGSDPAETLNRVNLQLWERNRSTMFVTVWLAVLEISTGKGLACNAGHEHPAFRSAGGKFDLLRYKHDMLVGVSPKAQYHVRPFEMHPGDCLFVYTDGIPEADNAAAELFGEKRLTDTLNGNADADPEELIRRVHDAVDRFADRAPQFDDITMLCLKYRGTA